MKQKLQNRKQIIVSLLQALTKLLIRLGEHVSYKLVLLVRDMKASRVEIFAQGSNHLANVSAALKFIHELL